jgi:hypothetical protein
MRATNASRTRDVPYATSSASGDCDGDDGGVDAREQ